MTPEEFRRHGYALVDWVAEYWSSLSGRRVTPDGPPGSTTAALAAAPPARGDGFAGLTDDLDWIIAPNLTHWQHPGFFAYFPANTSGPSVLADLVAAGLGVQGMLWSTGPACTELETVMVDWLAQLLDLCLFGTFVALERAAQEGIDPGPMATLDEIKKAVTLS